MKKFLSLALALLMLLALAVPAYAEQATATGTGKGIDGDVIVEVTADENTIYSIVVTQQNETPGIGSVAVEKHPQISRFLHSKAGPGLRTSAKC